MSKKDAQEEVKDNVDESGETVSLLNGKQRRECSWTCGIAEFIDDLGGAVGYKLLILLFFVEHVERGFVSDFTGQADSYMYKSYGVPGPQVNIFSGITQLPWALKPIIGLVSDMFPLGGYNKSPYMIAATVLGSLALVLIGIVPHSMLSVTMLVMCIFLNQTQLSVCDILAEAKYAARIQEVPAFGPHVLSYVWFGMNIGSLIGVLLSGVVLSSFSPKWPYLIAALPAAMVLIPLLLGCLEEKFVQQDEAVEARNNSSWLKPLTKLHTWTWRVGWRFIVMSMAFELEPPSLAQTYMRGPLVPHGHGKPLSKEELDGLRTELAAIKKEFGMVEPERAFMDEKDVEWRFGGPPDYTVANLYFLKGKTKNHPVGSLEMIVENLVKTWEMERSHKLDPNKHRSVDPKVFHLSANGGKKYNNDEANHIGNYSVLLEKCPVDIYDVDRINWEQSHEKFHSAFAAFPWEVLEVFSPPPRVSFTWRHWGHFTGSYEGKEGDGRLIEMYGFGVAVVNDKLQLVDVEIFYKPEPFIQSLRGTAGSSSTWRGADILGEGATNHCPFVEKQKRKGFPAGECPVRKAKCEQVKL